MSRFLPLVFFYLVAELQAQVHVNSTGCGTTNFCVFKPKGCDPNLDCTVGVVVSIVGSNQMRVQMAAQTLIPPVQQQYVAVAFSDDIEMGNDTVTECVLSDAAAFVDPEVYLSYNKGKANDRVYLHDEEHKQMFSNIEAEFVDGRLMCQFTQQLVPQFDHKDGLVFDLNRPFFMFAATGSAQPDEINVHDLNKGSHFFPVVSDVPFIPTSLASEFSHPTGYTPPPPMPKAPRPSFAVKKSAAQSSVYRFLTLAIVSSLFHL
ncbi:unnamed protein product [Caenorhabditis auriculariae]|uniref:DOMON domain-containing protein n=1 Tax=Caenorhabditis auriculariae TaxID=2777116 RepID=A0A8S1HIQ8_9PELO|nr:unnamed protein product [Caenorhabditis auriculariae]